VDRRQIDEYGIGTAAALSSWPARGAHSRPIFPLFTASGHFSATSILLLGARRATRQRRPRKRSRPYAACFFAVVVAVHCPHQGQRRIPTQSAKHSSRAAGLRRHAPFLPLRINQSGFIGHFRQHLLASIPKFPFFNYWRKTSHANWAFELTKRLRTARAGLTSFTSQIYFFVFLGTLHIHLQSKEHGEQTLKTYGSVIPGERRAETRRLLERVINANYVWVAAVGSPLHRHQSRA